MKEDNKPSQEREPLTPELEAKLKAVGFTQTEFEPKQNQRFIVTLDGIPSYAIKAVSLPSYERTNKWSDTLALTLYNTTEDNLEKAAIALGEEPKEISIKILGPVGDVLTTWVIKATLCKVEFDALDWEDKGKPSFIYVYFNVIDVEII